MLWYKKLKIGQTNIFKAIFYRITRHAAERRVLAHLLRKKPATNPPRPDSLTPGSPGVRRPLMPGVIQMKATSYSPRHSGKVVYQFL